MKKILSLVGSLTVVCGVCAAVLAYVNGVTEEPIKEIKVKLEQEAVKAVMPPGAEKVEAVAWADAEKKAPVAFAGKDATGKTVGYAAKGTSGEGYGGDIVLMVGFQPDRKTVVAYKTLSAAETPGLGMNLNTPEFSGQFAGKDGSSLKVKKDGGEIEAITSATITSRAVCGAIADAQGKFGKDGAKTP